MKKIKLYHGNCVKLDVGDYLTPHVAFDGKPLVYLTSDPLYAMIRCGKFNPSEFLIMEDYTGNDYKNGQGYTLVELQPNAFVKTFCLTGYIYTVEVDEQCITPGKLPNEFMCDREVEINDVYKIDNVLGAMAPFAAVDCLKLVWFEESEEFWKARISEMGPNGSKEAYLKRREERVNKIRGGI